MKPQFLFVLVAIYVISAGAQTPPDVEKNKKACLEELGIDGDTFDAEHPTKEQMCFFKCMGEKYDILDGDGNMKASSSPMGMVASSPEMRARVAACKNIESDDKCERAFKQAVCMKAIFAA